MNFAVLTWGQVEKDCIALARKITESEKQIDEIVSITRGGMVVSRILSDLLSLPISHIAIQSYEQLTGKEPVLTQASSKVFNGENILLVDELSDSGKTFKLALEYLSSLPLGEVVTAAPYIKPHTIFIPDFWVKSHDTWIVLPYELRETKESLIKGFGEEEGLKKLHELNIPDWEDVV